MKQFIFIILLVLGVAAIANTIWQSKPEAKKFKRRTLAPVVEIMQPKLTDYAITISTSGTVQAHTSTNIVSEVAGKINVVSPDFKTGKSFTKGDTLLKLDQNTLLNNIALAESDIAQQRSNLKQLNVEQGSVRSKLKLAQSNLDVGKKELNRLNQLWKQRIIPRSQLDREQQNVIQLQQSLADRQGQLDTFSSRKAAIKAAIHAAEVRLKQAQQNLTKTEIKAPFTGKVRSTNANIGQYITPGAILGNIYATNYVEIPLPLSLEQVDLITQGQNIAHLAIKLHTTINNNRYEWDAKIDRMAAEMDPRTRQVMAFARINNPFINTDKPLRIGQYLHADIPAKTLKNIYTLPASAIRKNREILLLKQGKIAIKPVTIRHRSNKLVYIDSADIQQNEKIIITSMPAAKAGSPVRLKGGKAKLKDKINNKHKKTPDKPLNKQQTPTGKH